MSDFDRPKLHGFPYQRNPKGLNRTAVKREIELVVKTLRRFLAFPYEENPPEEMVVLRKRAVDRHMQLLKVKKKGFKT